MSHPLRGQENKPRGFTLIEVLVMMTVFATAFLSLMGVYGNLAALRETGRNLNQATSDARAVLEMVREKSGAGLASVAATDWTQWARDNALTSLSGETVTLLYRGLGDQQGDQVGEYQGENLTDPLDVIVRVAWTDRRRARSMTLESLITQR